MPLVDLHAPPSRSMLRWFGLSLGCVLAIFGGLVGPWGILRESLFCLAVFIPLLYYAVPATKQPIIWTWQRLTFPIAFVVGHLLFGVVFFLVLTPIGLLLRIFRYDPLRRKKSDDITSLWRDRTGPAESEKEELGQYFRQF